MKLLSGRLIAALLAGAVLAGWPMGAAAEGTGPGDKPGAFDWLDEAPAPDPAAEAAFDAWIAERDAILTGRKEASHSWHEAVRGMQVQSERAETPLAREVYRRVALDQYGRQSAFFSLERSQRIAAELGHALEGEAVSGFQDRLVKSMMLTDRDNTAFLEAALSERGGQWWPLSEVGEELSGYLWLLTQHADMNPAFQRRALDLMAPLAEAGEVARQDYGFLFDRLAVADGRPQRFGSQGRCDGPSNWEPFEIEAPVAEVNARRAAFDFRMTFEENKARLDQQCGE